MAVRDIQAWNVSMLDINNAPVAMAGLATELELPTLEREFDTDKRAGESGIISRPKHFSEVECSFTLMSISEEFMSAILQNVAKTVTFNFSAAALDSAGASAVYSLAMRGFYNSLPFGNIDDVSSEIEIGFNVNFFTFTFGAQTMTYDPANYIYSVNGTNLLANIKTTLGL